MYEIVAGNYWKDNLHIPLSRPLDPLKMPDSSGRENAVLCGNRRCPVSGVWSTIRKVCTPPSCVIATAPIEKRESGVLLKPAVA
jgi:hypothetical protein